MDLVLRAHLLATSRELSLQDRERHIRKRTERRGSDDCEPRPSDHHQSRIIGKPRTAVDDEPEGVRERILAAQAQLSAMLLDCLAPPARDSRSRE